MHRQGAQAGDAMSFGTTERARMRNMIPLRRRFIVLSMPEQLWRARWNKQQKAIAATLKAVPGWDADGRPVEP